MKRFGMAVLALLVAASAFAQAAPGAAPPTSPGGPGAQSQNARRWMAGPPQPATISGTLTFVNDRPAVAADGKTYYFMMPRFYYFAYKDGIKEGAAVKADGFVITTTQTSPASGASVFIPRNVTINGKTYVIVRAPMDRWRFRDGMREDGQMMRMAPLGQS